jgi:hypothetical protein
MIRVRLADGHENMDALIDDLPRPFENEEIGVRCVSLTEDGLPTLVVIELPEQTYRKQVPHAQPNENCPDVLLDELLNAGARMPGLGEPLAAPAAPVPTRPDPAWAGRADQLVTRGHACQCPSPSLAAQQPHVFPDLN